MCTSYLAVNLQIKFSKFGGIENINLRLPLFIDRCRDLPYMQQKVTSTVLSTIFATRQSIICTHIIMVQLHTTCKLM
jgi:hypothetical protein